MMTMVDEDDDDCGDGGNVDGDHKTQRRLID